ncbi:MAG: hypothetical protein AMXMBFR47_17890 [Planctomycetota bacterium]
MNRFAAGTAGALALLSVPVGVAGLYEDLFRGLDYIVTPLGSPTFASGDGGAQNGARIGRLRIVPNRLGQGYRLEMDRNFGVDTRGRAEVYDLGPFELELNGSMQATAGFTSRFMMIGNTDITFSDLNYAIREKSGAQDVSIFGTLNGTQQMEVNQFGFYTLTLDLSNSNSVVQMDGVAVGGTRETNWDLGPISVKGNIYYDAALAVLDTFGVDTDGLNDLFPKSPIDRISQDIRDALAGQARVLGEQISLDSAAGIENPELAMRARDFMHEFVIAAGVGTEIDGTFVGPNVSVPEPAALALLAAGGVLLLRRR